MKIITNNIPRQLIYGYELTEEEKKDFDYLGEDIDGHDFFRYKGNVYDPDEFMRIENNSELKNWDGYSSDTYFSGVLIKYTQDNESVIVGRYFS
jgi:hypothetical protein